MWERSMYRKGFKLPIDQVSQWYGNEIKIALVKIVVWTTNSAIQYHTNDVIHDQVPKKFLKTWFYQMALNITEFSYLPPTSDKYLVFKGIWEGWLSSNLKQYLVDTWAAKLLIRIRKLDSMPLDSWKKDFNSSKLLPVSSIKP